jgi:hypothetical protein
VRVCRRLLPTPTQRCAHGARLFVLLCEANQIRRNLRARAAAPTTVSGRIVYGGRARRAKKKDGLVTRPMRGGCESAGALWRRDTVMRRRIWRWGCVPGDGFPGTTLLFPHAGRGGRDGSVGKQLGTSASRGASIFVRACARTGAIGLAAAKGARACANCPAISMRVPGVSIPCRFRRRQRADVVALGLTRIYHCRKAKGRGTS